MSAETAILAAGCFLLTMSLVGHSANLKVAIAEAIPVASDDERRSADGRA
jgi:hypothetical protein